MKNWIDLIEKHEVSDAAQLAARKRALLSAGTEFLSDSSGNTVYVRSLQHSKGVVYAMARDNERKRLIALSRNALDSPFDAKVERTGDYRVQLVEPGAANSGALHQLFGFTRPVSLREERTTVGMGDRLGSATVGHVRASRRFALSPVFAQQSIRELDFTGRTFADVVADASFAVFQEGYENGYGADGDHLKTISAIDSALEQHMPMITLDLTEVMRPEVADWPQSRIDEGFAALAADFRTRVDSEYAAKSFNLGEDTVIRIGSEEARMCAVMYGPALDFSKVVNDHLKEKTGDAYDLEISIDETTTPTLPSHHLFIARELQRRGVTVNSLAPRFVGEFQKAVDYIGDIPEFEKQLIVHCRIAEHFGTYKISVHSGSDKFSVYPLFGKHTAGRLHLKTSGTSWLEALRMIAACDPAAYRTIHRKAFEYFPEALKQYHITADIDAIPALDSRSDAQLPDFLEDPNCRQLLHISYGGLLRDPEIHDRFFHLLHVHDESYNDYVQRHFEKHMSLLGVASV